MTRVYSSLRSLNDKKTLSFLSIMQEHTPWIAENAIQNIYGERPRCKGRSLNQFNATKINCEHLILCVAANFTKMALSLFEPLRQPFVRYVPTGFDFLVSTSQVRAFVIVRAQSVNIRTSGHTRLSISSGDVICTKKPDEKS